MKFLVCISKAPDTTSRIAFTEGDTKFDSNGVQFIVNPYDEWYASCQPINWPEETTKFFSSGDTFNKEDVKPKDD